MTQYAKALLMVLVTGAAALVAALSDNRLTQPELINVVIALVGAASVFAAPNVPHAPVTKLILAALTAGLMALVSFIGAGGVTGVTVSQWIQIGIAVVGALGVFAVPNAQSLTSARAGHGIS